MKQLFASLIFICGFCLTANADVWKWVDAKGKTHFVDTMKPIYTWVDEFGKTHYGDTPDHEDAVSVQLVWHSSGALDPLADGGNKIDSGDYAFPGETAEARAEREKAEAYYCKRANEIYESYLNAPQLYRTNENGEREYLDKKAAAETIAKTKSKRDELCS